MSTNISSYLVFPCGLFECSESFESTLLWNVSSMRTRLLQQGSDPHRNMTKWFGFTSLFRCGATFWASEGDACFYFSEGLLAALGPNLVGRKPTFHQVLEL